MYLNKYPKLIDCGFIINIKKTEESTAVQEGQTCLGCNATSTPEWRRGPLGKSSFPSLGILRIHKNCPVILSFRQAHGRSVMPADSFMRNSYVLPTCHTIFSVFDFDWADSPFSF